MPIHKCSWYGEQTEVTRDVCGWYHWHNGHMVGWLLNWSIGIGCFKLFRKDRLERWGWQVALYVNDQLECMELCLENDEGPFQSLWVKTEGRGGQGQELLRVGICYRPPSWEDGVDEASADSESVFTLTGPDPHGELQPSWHMPEGQHGYTQTTQEVPWVCQLQLSYPSDWGANTERCHAGPCAYQQGGAGAAPRQVWLQWPGDQAV